MIPRHIIRKTARALYEHDRADYHANGGTEHRPPWHEAAAFTTQRPYTEKARVALEAVAADIWDDGYELGRAEDDGGSRINHNPYTQENT